MQDWLNCYELNAAMNEQNKRFINTIAIIISVAFEAASFGYIWYTSYIPLMSWSYFRRGNWAVIGFYALLMILVTNTFGGYKLTYMRLRDIVISHIASILIGSVLAYIEICMVTVRYYSYAPIIKLAAAQIIFAVLWSYLTRRVYVKLYPPRKVFMIFGDYSYEPLLGKFLTRDDRYDIVGIMSCYEDMPAIRRAAKETGAVLLCDLPDERRNTIIKYCAAESVRVYSTSKISDIMIRGAEDIHLFDMPLFLIRNNGIPADQRLIKRLMDIVLGTAGCILASPLMLLIAVAIKLCDGGPVIFTQERLTIGGKTFKMYKFRSMYVDSERYGARLAAKGDSRITPVGRVIRRLHFDELPQLFNIVKGDMSLVGPRPERAEIFSKYEEIIPEFRLRLKVKAGLTGYAQVYGQYNTTPYDKLKLDLTYIHNYSLLMDIRILMLTFKILFVKENTEGVEQDQKTALRQTKI